MASVLPIRGKPLLYATTVFASLGALASVRRLRVGYPRVPHLDPSGRLLLFLRRRLTLLAPTPSGTLCFGYDQGHVLLSILQDRLIGRVEAS
jgi:hypothetical protein